MLLQYKDIYRYSRNVKSTVYYNTALNKELKSHNLRLISTSNFILLQFFQIIYRYHFQTEHTIQLTLASWQLKVTSVVAFYHTKTFFHSSAYWTMAAFPYHSMFLFHVGILHPSRSTYITIWNHIVHLVTNHLLPSQKIKLVHHYYTIIQWSLGFLTAWKTDTTTYIFIGSLEPGNI